LSLKKLQKYEKYRYDLHTAILRTNSQIHDEASMILYGRNFSPGCPDSKIHTGLAPTIATLKAIPLRYIRLITRLRIEFGCATRYGGFWDLRC
jgi:hypothetical protein